MGRLQMSRTRIAINGFGRIDRMVLRHARVHKDLDGVAINASYPEETLTHLIKYDSVHGICEKEDEVISNSNEISGEIIHHVNSRKPEELPWEELGIDVVIAATGKFNSKEGASRHLKAGAKKVVVTAPGKGVDKTIVLGVNDED